MLIGFGVLLYTGWWWPGILVVLGIAIGAGLAFRRRYIPAAVVALIFFTLAFFAQYNMVPWDLAGPIALVAIGIIVLANALLKDQEPEQKEETK